MSLNSVAMPMLMSAHIVIVSDICVALVDPRVRFGE